MAVPPPGGLSEATAFKIILCPLKMTAAKSQRAQNRPGQTRCPASLLPPTALPSFPGLPHPSQPHSRLFRIQVVLLPMNSESDPASLQEQCCAELQRMSTTSWPSLPCGLPAVRPPRVTSEETAGQAHAPEEGEPALIAACSRRTPPASCGED